MLIIPVNLFYIVDESTNIMSEMEKIFPSTLNGREKNSADHRSYLLCYDYFFTVYSMDEFLENLADNSSVDHKILSTRFTGTAFLFIYNSDCQKSRTKIENIIEKLYSIKFNLNYHYFIIKIGEDKHYALEKYPFEENIHVFTFSKISANSFAEVRKELVEKLFPEIGTKLKQKMKLPFYKIEYEEYVKNYYENYIANNYEWYSNPKIEIAFTTDVKTITIKEEISKKK